MSKSIKFQNDTYLDSSSIAHKKILLSSILNTYANRKLLEFKGDYLTDMNEYYTPGIYRLGGEYDNSPVSGTVYGILVVFTSTGIKWEYSNHSSWLWQFIITTSGDIYLRTGINNIKPGNWTKLN